MTDPDLVASYASDIIVETKSVSKYFNPKTYYRNKSMEYRASYSHKSFLNVKKNTAVFDKVSIKKTEIEFWGNVILNTSGLDLFFKPE